MNLDHDEYEYIKKLKPDVVVVVIRKNYSSKNIRIKRYSIFKYSCIFVTKMERAAPIQRAIMNLDKETGISIMKIVPKLTQN